MKPTPNDFTNPYKTPNKIKEKYKRPDTDWGIAALIFFGIYGVIGLLFWLLHSAG